MTKDGLLFGIVGLLIGSIIGFMFANSVNRSAPTGNAQTQVVANGQNPAFPPGHPPIGGEQVAPGNSQSGGMMPEIAESIEKAKQEPNNFEAQMTAGDLYYQISRFEDAIRFFEAAAKAKPQDKEPHIKLGNSYYETRRYADAERAYAKAIEIDPKDVNVRSDFGLTFFLREPPDLDRAIKEFQAALAINANSEIALQNLAMAYSDKGDKTKLDQTLEKLQKINPNNPALERLKADPNPK